MFTPEISKVNLRELVEDSKEALANANGGNASREPHRSCKEAVRKPEGTPREAQGTPRESLGNPKVITQ